jgi:D-glycero-D-manno-heptose 1,7-bisphosphate phosphatase
MNKAIFLDRDGVINKDVGYVHKKSDFEFIQNAPEAIKTLNNLDYKVIVISNQSGVGRGYFSMDDVLTLQKFINDELSKTNAHIDAWYYCPHSPIDNCDCRKPKTLLVKRAIGDFNIDVSKSWFVGDKISDTLCAKNAGIKGILVGSGYECEYENLFDFVKNELNNL